MILRCDYAAHEAFVAPARPTAAAWRFILGLALVVGCYVALGRMFFYVLNMWAGTSSPAFADQVLEGLTPLPMLVLLFTFVFVTLAVAFVVRCFHRRPAWGLLGPMPLALRQFRAVLVLLIVLGAGLFVLPPWDMGGPLVPNLSMGLWAALLPVSLIALFVQVSAEEVLFRGYIQQQLAARFRSPLVWMVLPSVLFGLGHYLPEEAGENAVFIAVWASVFGILMADLTARAGSLGPAIAVHFYNNAVAILIVSVPDSLSGLALFHAPFGLADAATVRAWMPVDFAHMFVAWLVARLAIGR